MADTNQVEEAMHKKRDIVERMAACHIRGLEEFWNPNRDKSDPESADAGHYFASRMWGTDDITSVPPMCFTENNHFGYKNPRDSLQIISIKIASIRGDLKWPIDVFGIVTTRDVLDYRQRNISYARPRSNCETITEEHPCLTLSGPTRAVLTCTDPGSIYRDRAQS